MRVFSRSLYYIQSAFQNLTTKFAPGDGENDPEYSAFLLKVPSSSEYYLPTEKKKDGENKKKLR
jgi:hypothetical protein